MLALAYTSASAEWKNIGSIQNGNGIVYVNAEGVRMKGNFVKVWRLTNFPLQKKVLPTSPKEMFGPSNISQIEFDCSKKVSRMNNVSYFTSHMGKGTVMGNISWERNTEWKKISPRSLNATLSEIACTNL